MVDAITNNTAKGVRANSAADSSAGKSTPASPSTLNAKNNINTQPLNPRLVYDNLAGVVVTEFLNQSGSVQLQTPSNAVLAYLRVGLGVDGHSKYQPETKTTEPELTKETAGDTTFDS